MARMLPRRSGMKTYSAVTFAFSSFFFITSGFFKGSLGACENCGQ